MSIAVTLQSAAAAAGTTVIQTGGVEVIVGRSDEPITSASRSHRVAFRAARSHPRAKVPVVAIESALAGNLVQTALAFVGTPYRWGGASPSGFDCSGFTWYAFARLGISIPRTADRQFVAGRAVAGDPLPGDLVFFQTYDYGASHVGIYLGDGQFVNAIGPNVHIASFTSAYYRSRYLGARRFLPG